MRGTINRTHYLQINTNLIFAYMDISMFQSTFKALVYMAILLCSSHGMLHAQGVQVNHAQYIKTTLTQSQKADIKVFFDYAAQQLPLLMNKLEEMEQKALHDKQEANRLRIKINFLFVVCIIAAKDIEALKHLPKDALEFNNGQIVVSGQAFENSVNGRLAGSILMGENALIFALFHAALNTTQEDDEATLVILKLLLAKGLNRNPKAARVLWLKDSPAHELARDYVYSYSAKSVIDTFFPQAKQLFLEDNKS